MRYNGILVTSCPPLSCDTTHLIDRVPSQHLMEVEYSIRKILLFTLEWYTAKNGWPCAHHSQTLQPFLKIDTANKAATILQCGIHTSVCWWKWPLCLRGTARMQSRRRTPGSHMTEGSGTGTSSWARSDWTSPAPVSERRQTSSVLINHHLTV